jgi:hypothetical protein
LGWKNADDPGKGYTVSDMTWSLKRVVYDEESSMVMAGTGWCGDKLLYLPVGTDA